MLPSAVPDRFSASNQPLKVKPVRVGVGSLKVPDVVAVASGTVPPLAENVTVLYENAESSTGVNAPE